MTAAHPPIRVNRAPVLTLWAAVVAEHLGHPPDTALSLASAVAGTAARAKASRRQIAAGKRLSRSARPPFPNPALSSFDIHAVLTRKHQESPSSDALSSFMLTTGSAASISA
jgi:hypothetical protein